MQGIRQSGGGGCCKLFVFVIPPWFPVAKPPTAPPILGGFAFAADIGTVDDVFAFDMSVESPEVWFVDANWIFWRSSFLHAFDLNDRII